MSMSGRTQGRARRGAGAAASSQSSCSVRGQAIDLLGLGDGTSPPLARVHDAVRARVPTLDDDRPPSHDIDAIAEIDRDAASSNARAAMKVN